ncbi:MAG: hypothetical protein PHV34_07580 [Verrucomicrobiae bacterium]|nr:hypothetical protein [Verrucomicrobiae bacterium]
MKDGNTVYRCPADMKYYADSQDYREISYGINAFDNGGIGAIYPWGGAWSFLTRISGVANSAQTILLADSGHMSEDGGAAYIILPATSASGTKANYYIYPRHSQGANVLYVDGHTEYADAARLNEIKNDSKYWKAN